MSAGQGAEGRVANVNVSPQGGVPKLAVPSARVSAEGVSGDRQRNRRVHGGPERAVSLFSLERIEALRAEGHPIAPGTAGENLTIAGLDWGRLAVGSRLAIGEEVELQISSYTVPCETIEASFADGKFTRISQKLHPGWSRLYARVLREGLVREGDAVRLLAEG
jgi:MOSC domain-containing protein YiiM